MSLVRWHDAVHHPFWQRVSSSCRATLLLDYDGTLAPFVTERDKAVPYAGVRERLEILLEYARKPSAKSRLVFITGRPALELVPLLQLSSPVEIWGGHGAEHLDTKGQLTVSQLSPRVSSLLDRAYLAALEHIGAVQLERKQQSVALHVRGLEPLDAAVALDAVWDRWEQLVGEEQQADMFSSSGGVLSLEAMAVQAALPECAVHEFKGGIELRVAKHTKAVAVQKVLSQEPFGTAIAFLGDDRTDEDGFAALPDLQDGGLGVLVAQEERASAASWLLKPPQELLSFLDCWIEAVISR